MVEVGDLCPAAVAPSTTPPPSQVQAISRGAEEQESGLRNKATDSEEASLTSLELSALSPLFSPLNRRAFSAPDGVHPGDPTVARNRLAMAWDPAAPDQRDGVAAALQVLNQSLERMALGCRSTRRSRRRASTAGVNQLPPLPQRPGHHVPAGTSQCSGVLLTHQQTAAPSVPPFSPPARQFLNRRRCPADP